MDEIHKTSLALLKKYLVFINCLILKSTKDLDSVCNLEDLNCFSEKWLVPPCLTETKWWRNKNYSTGIKNSKTQLLLQLNPLSFHHMSIFSIYSNPSIYSHQTIKASPPIIRHRFFSLLVSAFPEVEQRMRITGTVRLNQNQVSDYFFVHFVSIAGPETGTSLKNKPKKDQKTPK